MRNPKTLSLATLAALILAGCLLEPEKKPDKIITIDCRNSFDEYDTTGAAHFSCPVNDSSSTPSPRRHP